MANTFSLADKKDRSRTAKIYKTTNDLLKLHLMMQVFVGFWRSSFFEHQSLVAF